MGQRLCRIRALERGAPTAHSSSRNCVPTTRAALAVGCGWTECRVLGTTGIGLSVGLREWPTRQGVASAPVVERKRRLQPRLALRIAVGYHTGLDLRVVNPADNGFIRRLTLHPSGGYQPATVVRSSVISSTEGTRPTVLTSPSTTRAGVDITP